MNGGQLWLSKSQVLAKVHTVPGSIRTIIFSRGLHTRKGSPSVSEWASVCVDHEPMIPSPGSSAWARLLTRTTCFPSNPVEARGGGKWQSKSWRCTPLVCSAQTLFTEGSIDGALFALLAQHPAKWKGGYEPLKACFCAMEIIDFSLNAWGNFVFCSQSVHSII